VVSLTGFASEYWHYWLMNWSCTWD